MAANGNAEIVREALIHGPPYAESDDMTALAALAALEQERDAFKRARLDDVRLIEGRIEALKRAEAAELALAEMRRERNRAQTDLAAARMGLGEAELALDAATKAMVEALGPLDAAEAGEREPDDAVNRAAKILSAALAAAEDTL